MLLAVICIIAGIIIFAHPLLGLTTLTLFAIVALFVAGVAKLFWAFKVDEGRWFLVLSGVLSILIAGMLYTNFPFSAAWRSAFSSALPDRRRRDLAGLRQSNGMIARQR